MSGGIVTHGDGKPRFNPNRDDETGRFAVWRQPEPAGVPIEREIVSESEARLRNSREVLRQARSDYNQAARTVVAETILKKLPTAVTVTTDYDYETSGDDGHTLLSKVTDSEGNELWAHNLDSDPYSGPFAGANDLIGSFGLGRRTIDLTPYRALPVELLVLKIKLAGGDEKERLVDNATDDERQVLAENPDPDIRFLVARSPETDVDTLTLLLGDSDQDVSAAAEHSLG